MDKGFRYAILTTIVLLLASCSSTKYVPDGSYLLDEVRIHTDNKEVKPSNLSMYIRQNPNAKWFSLYMTGASPNFLNVRFIQRVESRPDQGRDY